MIGGEELEQRFRLDGDFEQVTRVCNLGDNVCIALVPRNQVSEAIPVNAKRNKPHRQRRIEDVSSCAIPSRRWPRPPRRGIWPKLVALFSFFPEPTQEDPITPNSRSETVSLFCAQPRFSTYLRRPWLLARIVTKGETVLSLSTTVRSCCRSGRLMITCCIRSHDKSQKGGNPWGSSSFFRKLGAPRERDRAARSTVQCRRLF